MLLVAGRGRLLVFVISAALLADFASAPERPRGPSVQSPSQSPTPSASISYIITPVGEPPCASELPSPSCAKDTAHTVGFPVVWLPISTEFGPSGGDPLGFQARDQ